MVLQVPDHHVPRQTPRPEKSTAESIDVQFLAAEGLERARIL